MSLTSLLTKVFISLHSINYHPISKSHRSAALLLQHSVNSVHLVGADTFKFAHFFELTLLEFKEKKKKKHSLDKASRSVLMRFLELHSSLYFCIDMV